VTVPTPSPTPSWPAASLTTKGGWRAFVDTPPCPRPEVLTAAQLGALGPDARWEYDESRMVWHANFGTIVTPQLQAARMELELRVAANRQRGDQVRPATALDGLPGVGKTTIADAFCADYDRAARRRMGERTPDGDEHWPVLRIGLTSNTTLRSLNYGICDFYGRPGIKSANADQLGRWAIELVIATRTSVALIDEVHFIDVRAKDGVRANNHLKYLANVLPVTFIFTGVGLTERRYINEGLTGTSAVLAQTARRWTTIRVEPFRYVTDIDRADWATLLCTVEEQLLLTRAVTGMLTGQAGYLFERTGGYIGSLVNLVRLGCAKAMLTGVEALPTDLLDTIRVDDAAEGARAGTRAVTKQAARRRPSGPQPKSQRAPAGVA